MVWSIVCSPRGLSVMHSSQPLYPQFNTPGVKGVICFQAQKMELGVWVGGAILSPGKRLPVREGNQLGGQLTPHSVHVNPPHTHTHTGHRPMEIWVVVLLPKQGEWKISKISSKISLWQTLILRVGAQKWTTHQPPKMSWYSTPSNKHTFTFESFLNAHELNRKIYYWSCCSNATQLRRAL